MTRQRFALLALVLAACDQVEPVDEESATIPRSVQDAFTRSCATEGCHTAEHPIDLTPEGAPAVLDLEHDGMPVVVLGDPSGSVMGLALMAEPPEGILQMPLERTDQSLTDAAVVLAWIAGAEMPAMIVDGD